MPRKESKKARFERYQAAGGKRDRKDFEAAQAERHAVENAPFEFQTSYAGAQQMHVLGSRRGE